MPGSQDGEADESTRYYVRRPGGNVIGPFDKNAIRLMVQADKISQDAELSPDKHSWTPLADFDELVGASSDTQDAGRPSVNLPDSARGEGDDASQPDPTDAELPTTRDDVDASGGDAELPTPKDEPSTTSEGAELPTPKQDSGAGDSSDTAADAELPTSAKDTEEEGAELPAPKRPDAGGEDTPDEGSDQRDDGPDSNGPDLSGLRNRLDLPKPKSSDDAPSDDAPSDDAPSDKEDTSGGLDLPTPADTASSASDEESSGAGHSGPSNLPTSKDAPSNLPTSGESAQSGPTAADNGEESAELPTPASDGDSPPDQGPPDLPTPKSADDSELPASKDSADLPTSKAQQDAGEDAALPTSARKPGGSSSPDLEQSDDSQADLPRAAEDNLPRDAGENLPRDAEDNLPKDAGDDLPRAAEDNLPTDAGDSQAGDELFDAPASEDDALFDEDEPTAEAEASAPPPEESSQDPFDDEEDLFSEPAPPSPEGAEDANESKALELGEEIGSPDAAASDGGPQAPPEEATPADPGDADDATESAGEQSEQEPIRLDDDPEPFGDISDDETSEETDESPSDIDGGDNQQGILDDEEQALFDSPAPTDTTASDDAEHPDDADASGPAPAPDSSPDSKVELGADDLEPAPDAAPTADDTAGDDPLRVEAPGGADSTDGADDQDYDDGEFITEPAGGDMDAGQRDPDPEGEEEFEYGEVDLGEDADDSLELDAQDAEPGGMDAGAQPPPSQGPPDTSDPSTSGREGPPAAGDTDTAETRPDAAEATAPSDADEGGTAPALIGLLVLALAGAGGWYGYTMWGSATDTPATDDQTPSAESSPDGPAISLSLEALAPDTFGDYRSVLKKADEGSVSGAERGTLLLTRSLFLTRYDDDKVRASADKLASTLSDANKGKLALGRGAWEAAQGHSESARSYLNPLFESEESQLAYFAHLSAGIADVLDAQGTPADSDTPADQSSDQTSTTSSNDTSVTATTGGRDADDSTAETTTDRADAGALAGSAADGGTAVSPTASDNADAGETPPTRSRVEASESRADRADKHLAAATDMFEKRAAPLYWRGRLAELRDRRSEAIDHYTRAIERQSNHVASHLQISRVLFQTGDLKQASRHVSTILTELGARAASSETADAYHLDGEIALARSQTQPAIDSFKKALNINAKRPDTIRRLMQTFERADNYKAALTVFSNDDNFDQTQADILLARARAHIGLEEWSNAIDVLETGESTYPDDARFPYRLGELYMRKANSREARRSMRRAVKLDPTLLEARAALAHLAWITDQNAAVADQHVSKILEHPDDIDAEVATRVAEYYRDRGLVERAREWLTEALDRNPNFWPARLGLSQLYLEQDQADRALEMLEAARADGVDDIRLSAHLADAYRQTQKFDRAIQAINQVIDQDPNTATWYVIRGRIHFDRGNWQTALSNFRRAKELDPQNYRAIFYIGRTQYAQQAYERALDTFRGILDYRSQEGAYQDWMARTLFQMGRHQKALSHFERAVSVDPEYAERHPEMHVRYADLLLSLGYTERALQRVDTALELAPDSLDAQLTKANIFFEKENYQRAKQLYRSVLETDDARAEAHYKLGMSYLLENQRRDAAQSFQKAIHHGYDQPDVYEKLGYIYKELGRNQQAVDSFKQFLKQSDPSSLATETRREILNQIEALGG